MNFMFLTKGDKIIGIGPLPAAFFIAQALPFECVLRSNGGKIAFNNFCYVGILAPRNIGINGRAN